MPQVFIVGLPDVTRHLGNLAAGLADLNRIRATIGTPVDYAEAVHEGSRAHDIVPRFKRALFWPGAGHPVMRVHHPGTAANPFLREAFHARKPAIMQSIVDGLDVAIRNGEMSAAGPFGQAMERTNDLAQEMAPVGPSKPGHRGGTLRDSLHTEFYAR
jgi:hypothetical protein